MPGGAILEDSCSTCSPAGLQAPKAPAAGLEPRPCLPWLLIQAFLTLSSKLPP
jgi:hypothetical protein